MELINVAITTRRALLSSDCWRSWRLLEQQLIYVFLNGGGSSTPLNYLIDYLLILKSKRMPNKCLSYLCRNNYHNVRHPRSVAAAKEDTHKALCQRCQYVFMFQQGLEINRNSKYTGRSSGLILSPHIVAKSFHLSFVDSHMSRAQCQGKERPSILNDIKDHKWSLWIMQEDEDRRLVEQSQEKFISHRIDEWGNERCGGGEINEQ